MALENYRIFRDTETGIKRICFLEPGPVDPETFEQDYEVSLSTQEEIPQDSWDANDIVEILSGILEDSNHHAFVDLPQVVLDSLHEARGISKYNINNIMQEFMKRFYEML